MASVKRGRRLMGEINVVPYIDVMLVLLIIFMVLLQKAGAHKIGFLTDPPPATRAHPSP